MKKPERNILNYWRFYTQDKEAFAECLEKKYGQNLDSLRITNKVVALVTICFSFFPVVVEGQLAKGLVYLVVATIAGLMSLYAKRIYSQHKSGDRPRYLLLNTLITLYYSNLMLFGVYLDVWSDAKELAVMSMIFMVIALFLFVNAPMFNLILTSCAIMVFIVSTVLLKEPDTAIYDSIDILIAGIASTVFTWYVARYKVQSELDVGKLNVALENVKRANEHKSRFLATMSHEIRTPMNAIVGISDIELEKDEQASGTRDAFERINSSGKTLLGIINDILDLSKVETGKLELLPVKYDTSSLLNDTLRLNVMRIGVKPLKFIVKISANLPTHLIGDELRIKQILNNILSNAVKYTEQGSVTFEIDSRPDEKGIMLIFTVRDTGQGMSGEQLATIYDEHSMFNREANRGMEGTGLGMGITKGLVEMMQGQIMAESTVGAGSTFVVSLLQQPAGADVLGREMAEKLQNFTFSPGMQRAKVVREHMPYGSILVVDDVEANIFVAKGLLKPYGLAVDSADSGYEALEKIRTGASYDIIFMDHMMPGMDGIEATKLLRAEGYARSIIALTANAVAGMKEMFAENGFDNFVSKPIDIRQLNHVLNTYVRDKHPPAVAWAARQQKESGDFATTNAASTADAIPTAEDGDHGDRKAFTIEVHGLKSVLKSIGAATLGEAAARLERAATAGDLSYCMEAYPAFRAGLLELSGNLEGVLRPETAGPKQQADKAALMQVLAEVKAAAEAFDQNAARDLLAPHTAYSYDAETDGLLEGVMAALEAFDCAGAVAQLERVEP